MDARLTTRAATVADLPLFIDYLVDHVSDNGVGNQLTTLALDWATAHPQLTLVELDVLGTIFGARRLYENDSRQAVAPRPQANHPPTPQHEAAQEACGCARSSAASPHPPRPRPSRPERGLCEHAPASLRKRPEAQT